MNVTPQLVFRSCYLVLGPSHYAVPLAGLTSRLTLLTEGLTMCLTR